MYIFFQTKKGHDNKLRGYHTSVLSHGSFSTSCPHVEDPSKTAKRHLLAREESGKFRLIKSFPVASQIARADIFTLRMVTKE